MGALLKKYKEELLPKLKQELGISNPMALPTLSKVVVSIGVKEALSDKKNIDRASAIISQITGQKAKVTKAKQSIATFKLRQGDEIGVMVTLRGKRMYDFFEKLVSITLPRVRDFRGVSKTSFDGKGNYTMGFSESTVFPEIDPGKIEKVSGVQITIVTSARNDKEGFALLTALGMPFVK